MTVLLVEFGELIEVVVINTIAPFDRAELLTSGSKMEALEHIYISLHADESIMRSTLTSVLIAKGGFQLSGGIIFAMPYLLPSGAILRIYWIGSRNSSSVGLNVGASGMPKTRLRCASSGGSVGCPLRSTDSMSRGSARRCDRGMAWLFPDGGPFSVPGAVCGAGLAGFAFAAGGVMPDDGPALGVI